MVETNFGQLLEMVIITGGSQGSPFKMYKDIYPEF
jgi:hypothetical protein